MFIYVYAVLEMEVHVAEVWHKGRLRKEFFMFVREFMSLGGYENLLQNRWTDVQLRIVVVFGTDES
jgi:hypothetical protein